MPGPAPGAIPHTTRVIYVRARSGRARRALPRPTLLGYELFRTAWHTSRPHRTALLTTTSAQRTSPLHTRSGRVCFGELQLEVDHAGDVLLQCPILLL